jgi:hypothetical protein
VPMMKAAPMDSPVNIAAIRAHSRADTVLILPIVHP